MRSLFCLCCILVSTVHAGEIRTWSNPDGTKTFQAEFIERNGNIITLVRSDGKKFNIDGAKLNKTDLAWIDKQSQSNVKSDIENPSDSAVFDTLEFGDDQETVSKKLKASKMLDGTVEGFFQGRTGFNGIYRIREKVGGLYCYLFFDWDEDNLLREITLRTESKKGSEYDSALRDCWAALIELMSPIYGKPASTAAFPEAKRLTNGQIIGSHLWHLDDGNCALLGTSKIDDEFQITLRFTTEKIGGKP